MTDAELIARNLCIVCGKHPAVGLQCDECRNRGVEASGANADFPPAKAAESSMDGSRGAKLASSRARLAGKIGTPKMTRTERRMAAVLDADPDVASWVFEGLSLKIAARRRYRPDFYVVHVDGTVELREVKRRGMWETAHAASRVRFDVARDKYPEFRWSWYEWDSAEKQWRRLI